MSFVQPFQFEPERNINEEDSTEYVSQNDNENDEQEGRDEARAGQNRWCICGKCVSMVTERESVCCQELPFLSAEVNGIPCITAHENFDAVCLNRDVLRAALVSLHDRESAALPSRTQITNRSYRYASYRQFTWWTHGRLGRRIRRVIPACAVNKIRSFYPEPSGLYTGFRDVDRDDTEVDESWRHFTNI